MAKQGGLPESEGLGASTSPQNRVFPTGCPQKGRVERQTYSFKETLEELDLLVHGFHLGLQLHLIGISCVHVLKDNPAIARSLPV